MTDTAFDAAEKSESLVPLGLSLGTWCAYRQPSAIKRRVCHVGRLGERLRRIDAKEAGERKWRKTIPIAVALGGTRRTSARTLIEIIDADYQLPFTFDGSIEKITLDINHSKLSEADIKQLEAAMKSHELASISTLF